ncbi:MAG: hypothetical protein CMI60_03920 [Parvibaculum sp.]|jgi:hypothetical protein|nr:hypothetical protein [Parvibaculum sp.]
MVDDRKDIERGRIAQDILDNEIFQDAMIMLEEQYKNLWAITKQDQQEERERLWIAMKLIPEFERQLRIVVENGTIKKNQIVKIKQNIA